METPVGRLLLCCDADGLTAIRFHTQETEADAHPLLLRTEEELNEYFAGRRRRFSVPLSIHGSDFQKKVWRTLAEIPYGETACYLDIAERLGNPRACRAVGMANHNNPLPIIIPCHRVVGKDGGLTGYAGGVDMKAFLLKLERQHAEI